MWVVFRKSDGAVVGSTADSAIAVAKESALQEVIANLADAKNPNDFDAIEVKDREKLSRLAERATRRQAKVQTSKAGNLELVDDLAEPAVLAVSTNATQFHPIDKVPLIPGDGQSFLVVTLQKVDTSGKPMNRKTKDNEVIWLRTTNGSLREDKDQNPQEIRSLTLAAGTASFRIYSEPAKRLATVQMLTANPDLTISGLQVEFI
ncbi:MAG TPA: hypothetical protein VEW48_19910 [Thermoanaerobaculia bacterium]|nr:hypothetical protein [Thermoanaerobaculia bacterium]